METFATKATRSSLVRDILKLFPKLGGVGHKGQSGKLVVLGGSKDYTGAPFYAAISSIRAGGDLCKVLATAEASPIIKGYSPELIVTPYDEIDFSKDESQEKIDTLKSKLKFYHTLVMGCGLGIDGEMKQKNDPIMLKQLMTHAAETNMMLVGDADFCHYLKSSKIVMDLYTSPDEALRIPERTILTPNIMEFKRIWNSLYSEDYDPEYSLIDLYESLSEDIGELDLSLSISQDVTRVANSLNGATILKKGLVDIISDGNRVFYVKTKGSLKRCGGQGDVLAGTIGTYAYYAKLVKENEETVLESFTKEENPLLLAAVAGSVITRMACSAAFEMKGRSLALPDILENYRVEEYLESLKSSI